jgi:hypothetical protein
MIIFGIIALGGLGVFFLGFAFSTMVQLRWGRHREAPPFTLLEQRIWCVLWGTALVGISSVLTVRTFWAGSISQLRWGDLLDFLFVTAVANTLVLALVGSVKRPQLLKSRRRWVLFSFCCLLAVLAFIMGFVSLWSFVRH